MQEVRAVGLGGKWAPAQLDQGARTSHLPTSQQKGLQRGHNTTPKLTDLWHLVGCSYALILSVQWLGCRLCMLGISSSQLSRQFQTRLLRLGRMRCYQCERSGQTQCPIPKCWWFDWYDSWILTLLWMLPCESHQEKKGHTSGNYSGQVVQSFKRVDITLVGYKDIQDFTWCSCFGRW